MRTLLLFLFLFMIPGAVSADREALERSRILYLIGQNHLQEGLDLYSQLKKRQGQDDYDLLQDIGVLLLENGMASPQIECQLMATFGAGIAAHDRATQLLADGLQNPQPQIQLASLDFLSRLGNDDADRFINSAAASDQLLIRLYALQALAKKKHPHALGQIEALYHKVLPQLRPIFPQLFAMVGGPGATKQLRRMLHDADEDVRLETIVSIAKEGRDDLLPQIRMLLMHPNAREQEACALVLGELGDQASIPRLKTLTKSRLPDVQLAAYAALYELGQHETEKAVEEMALGGNPFALTVLGGMEGSEECLAAFLQCPDTHLRCNATLALLKRRDERCVVGLPEILLKDTRDLAFEQVTTRGGALTAWKVMQHATTSCKETPVILELSTAMREDALVAALELPEGTFLKIASGIFRLPQPDLIPVTVELLESLGTPAAIQLLNKHQQQVGTPLVRLYCTLALFKLGEGKTNGEQLRQWLISQQSVDMIQFRPYVTLEHRVHGEHYQLTPQETSKLFLATVEALSEKKSEEGIQVLLQLIRDGNERNRYALAGLLIRAAQ